MKIQYRPEIEGLRAISVIAVILYHTDIVLFGKNLFKGGFLGVDIFFIISGYLITNIILYEYYYVKKVKGNEKFKLSDFYEKRIRRIFPVLLFVIILTSFLSYFILLPSSLLDFGKSIFSILLLYSNFYFWFTGSQYGQESELIRPLLHNWSLSIELQFYFIFPLLTIIIIKFFKKKYLFFLFLIFFLSLLLSDYFSRTYPSLNFYSSTSRLFEFSYGSLLSYLELNNKNKIYNNYKFYPLLNQICPKLGIILIIYSILFFDFDKIFHPSFITLLPLTGIGLVIWFSKKGELVTKILSSKIFIFFGIISYSLYLWHYPIFAYLRYAEIFNNSITIKLLAIILTLILSVFSYNFIEKPFRNKKIISKNKLFFYFSFFFIVLMCYSIYIVKSQGIKNRFPNIITEDLRVHPGLRSITYNNPSFPNVIMIGDSHGDSLNFYLGKRLREKNFNFNSFTTSFYMPGFKQLEAKTGRIEQSFQNTNNNITEFLKNNNNKIVIIHKYWSNKYLETTLAGRDYLYYNEFEQNNYNEKKEKKIYKETIAGYIEPINISSKSLEERQKYFSEGLKLTVNSILENAEHIIIVYPVPEMIVHVPRFALSKYLGWKDKILTKNNSNIKVEIISVAYDFYKKRNKKILEILDDIQGPNIHRVFPDKLFCNTMVKDRCVANSNEHLFYFDDNHLSLHGSKYVVDEIIKIVDKIENKKN